MDGKNKKKNKKKKGNQGKITEDVSAGTEEVAIEQNHSSAVAEQNHGLVAAEQNHYPHASSNADVQSVGVSESDVELERHKMFEEKCVKLQEDVTKLENEKNLLMQKEAILEEKVKLLQNDLESCIQKEASLEERVRDLQIENDSSRQKEASLEERVRDLQIENDSSRQKEAILDEKVKHIEGIKDSWILKETSINKLIVRMDETKLELQLQVKELKESRDCLIQENAHLMESLKALGSRVEHLETETSFLRSCTMNPAEEQYHNGKNSEYQVDAAHTSKERLEAENAELAEKANEAYKEQLDQHFAADKHSSIEPDQTRTPVKTATPTPIKYSPEYGEEIFELSEKIHSLERSHEAFGISHGVGNFGSLNGVRQGQLVGLEDSRISEEIVSVPLDDIQVQEPEPQTVEIEEEPALPLSDAPLIGAPFRLISFVAKYVSGADLVSQDKSKSVR